MIQAKGACDLKKNINIKTLSSITMENVFKKTFSIKVLYISILFFILLNDNYILCNMSKISNKKVSVVEAVFDSRIEDIRWLGPKFKTVICRTKNGGFYRSLDSGKNWIDARELLKNTTNSPTTIFVASFFVHSQTNNTVVIVGRSHVHFISTDAAQTFRELNHQNPIHGFLFHPTRENWALMSFWTPGCSLSSRASLKKKEPCRHDLYITKDSGITFSLIVRFVVQYSWGSATINQQDCIYYSQFHPSSKTDILYQSQSREIAWSNSIHLYVIPNTSQPARRLVERGNKFLVSNQYIFVARLQDEKKQITSFLVSRDGGMTFKESKLPLNMEEKSYSILDTSQDSIILHVNHGHPTREGVNVGNVYISDKEGLHFSLSLPRNVRSNSGECEFDSVSSLEGFYIANFCDTTPNESRSANTKNLDKDNTYDDDLTDLDMEGSGFETGIEKRHKAGRKGKNEAYVKTVITFDKGGVWNYLKPPTIDSRGVKVTCDGHEFTAYNNRFSNISNRFSIPGESPVSDTSKTSNPCYLHLHGISNYHRYAPFYCVNNAVGLIMGTGNVGPYLRYEEDQVNTYLSRDGGLTWAEVHKGAYIYEFGDHGGLIVMADDLKATNQVVFSWNEGQSWYDFDIGDKTLNVDNIVIEPNSSSVEFLLYGTRGTAGVLYHLDFETLGQPMCKGPWAADSVASDYQTWNPTDGRTGDQCIMGKKLTFTRRKPTSECFNGRSFAPVVEKESCLCTEKDYECEVGFTREINTLECIPDESSLSQSGCVSSGIYYRNAYRKVPGNTCKGGWTPRKIPIMCPKTAPFSKRAIFFLSVISLLLILLIIKTFFRDHPKLVALLEALGLRDLSTQSIAYSVLGTKPEFFNTGYPSQQSNVGHPPTDRSRTFVEATNRRHTKDDRHSATNDDEENIPPLLEFSTRVPIPPTSHIPPHNRPSQNGNTRNDDLFFMSSSTGTDQQNAQYPNVPQMIPSFETDASQLSSSLQPQSIPRLQPPPFTKQFPNSNHDL